MRLNRNISLVLVLALGLGLAVACERTELPVGGDGSIVFGAVVDDMVPLTRSDVATDCLLQAYSFAEKGDGNFVARSIVSYEPIAKPATRMTEVTSVYSTGFYVTGFQGSTPLFTNVLYSRITNSNDPDYYYYSNRYKGGDAYWPGTEPSPAYSFIASNRQVSGSPSDYYIDVNAADSQEPVIAYLPTSTWKAYNAFSFQHIFGKLGTVTVESGAGLILTDISMSMEAATGGRYHFLTDTWTNLTTETFDDFCPVNEANSYGIYQYDSYAYSYYDPDRVVMSASQDNEIWLVPGTYDLEVTYSGWQYGEYLTDVTATAQVTVVAGQVSNVTFVFSEEDIEPLTIEMAAAGTLTFDQFSRNYSSEAPQNPTTFRLFYKVNGGEWQGASDNGGTTLSLSAGDKVRVWAEGSHYLHFNVSSQFYAYGNVASLFATQGPSGGSIGGRYLMPEYLSVNSPYGNQYVSSSVSSRNLNGLFYGCSGLRSHPTKDIVFPYDWKYGENALQYMFAECTGLVRAPRIELSYIGERTLYGMFVGCTSLTTVPCIRIGVMVGSNNMGIMFKNCHSLTSINEFRYDSVSNCQMPFAAMFTGCMFSDSPLTLPVSGVVGLNSSAILYDFSYMFDGCVGLVTAPDLPPFTDLSASRAYYSDMFRGCTSLVNAPELPATTLWSNCYSYMFEGCTSLVNAPDLPAETLTNACYSHMFSGCTSLQRAPDLLARTLVRDCYYGMFYGCSSLNYIKAMFTTNIYNSNGSGMSQYPYTYEWVSGVASSGTFVYNQSIIWTLRGVSSCPSGWTLQRVAN